MLINEVTKRTGLTRKAVEYYIEQKLVCPGILENGYRDFREDDLARLEKISVLRRLGLNIDCIRLALADQSGTFLQKLAVQKQLQIHKDQEKQRLLEKLGSGADYPGLAQALDALEQNSSIAEKLLNAFPGYYGQYACLHFSGFLNDPISSPEQKEAYQTIVAFLDSLPAFRFPKKVQDYLDEFTSHLTVEHIKDMAKNVQASLADPEKFLSENKEALEQYYQYMRSDEYKDSVAYQLKTCLMEFNSSTGYNDIFIPAMKRLSPSYAKYCRLLDIAGERIAQQFPEAAGCPALPPP